MNIVVDTNIFISALIKESLTRYVIFTSKETFLFPEFEFLELKNHYSEIIDKSRLNEKEFLSLLRKLLGIVKIIRMKETFAYKERAKKIMDKIDLNDAPFIASALATKAVIWSDDRHFKKQNEVPTYNTKEMLSLISKNDS